MKTKENVFKEAKSFIILIKISLSVYNLFWNTFALAQDNSQTGADPNTFIKFAKD